MGTACIIEFTSGEIAVGMFSKSKPPPDPPKPINDQFLREHGFSIHSRPQHGSPSWFRRGKVYTEHQATRMAVDERRRSLEALESK